MIFKDGYRPDLPDEIRGRLGASGRHPVKNYPFLYEARQGWQLWKYFLIISRERVKERENENGEWEKKNLSRCERLGGIFYLERLSG